jgi:hypothetical protein
LNAIFARAPNVNTYRSELSIANRREIEKFSVEQVKEITELLKPQKIITVEFELLWRLSKPIETELKSDGGRDMTKKGSIAGREARASILFTGAHAGYSRLRARLAEYTTAQS